MSKEVLGSGADVLEAEAPVRPPAPTVEVTDLDDPAPVPPPQRAHRRTRPALRAAAPLLAAALGGAFVGGVAGSGATERAVLAERRDTVRVLAAITVPDRGAVDVSDDRRLQLTMVLLNAGPEPVTVTEARVDGSRTSVRLDHSVEIPAGRSAEVPASVLPDCGGPGGGDLRLLVTTADRESRDVAAGTLARDVGLSPGELVRFCGPTLEQDPIPVWRTRAEDDGWLWIHLRNVREEPVELYALAPPGTRIVGDPALPVTLPTDRSVFVRLRVEVERCTSAAQRASAGMDIDFLVDGERGYLAPDAATVVGWYAQQVALACSGD